MITMLIFQDVTFLRGNRMLLRDASFKADDGDVIGLTGANGCGKSSLFAAIRGEFALDNGEIQLGAGTQISSLAQEVPGLETSVINYVIEGDTQIANIFKRLAKAEASQDHTTIVDCHNQLTECDGYGAQARAAKILAGLGFDQKAIHQAVKTFSGGWRMRMGLARCLYHPGELLLLDEPTNHLDMEAIIWLGAYLRRYAGVAMLISHDRDFLDQVVTDIAHIENTQLKLYPGNYSHFEMQRAQAIMIQNAQHRKQQAHIAHLQKYVDRFRFKASKAKQAQSRIKALERMNLVQALHESSPFSFEFLAPERMPSPMVTIDNATLGYEDVAILDDINLSIAAGDRIGLLGVNGSGKSTLIKSIVGDIPPLLGNIQRSPGLEIGYFDQHQVDALDADDTPIMLMRRLSRQSSEKDLISYFAKFGFSRDQSMTRLERFSGGEKSRVALALIIWQRPNLLLLDEPTNHLDMETRQALMMALQAYEGSTVLVSHDRYLLRSLVNELYLVEHGRVDRFDGSVDDYQPV